ncbi:MAG: type 4a pilus biogenesis protein PilO [Armatimonadetes bacterium]|nr:type 4a pilus biogenesis protein PilO [Armatimonadota bacterium]
MKLGDNLATWNAACIAVVVAIVGVIVFDRVAPKPRLKDTITKLDKSRRELMQKTAAGKLKLETATKGVEQYTWQKPVTEVGPAVLDKINLSAMEKGVKVTTFRPQRVQAADPLKVAEFTVSIQGQFLQVVAFVNSLEAPESKLVVSSAQISSTDAATSLTSASIGLMAFVKEPEAAKPAEGVNNGKA